jgi:hypothetical protein
VLLRLVRANQKAKIKNTTWHHYVRFDHLRCKVRARCPVVCCKSAARLFLILAFDLFLEGFGGHVSQRRVFVQVADNLSAEQPHIADVVLDGSFRQAGPAR